MRVRSEVRLASIVIALQVISAFFFSVQAYEAQLRTVAAKFVMQLETAGQKSGTVLDFTDLQGQGTELGRFLAQEFADQLVGAAKSISFIDRANLQHLLKENKLSMEGLVNPESSRRLGNLIGIDTIIFGTVTPIGKSVRLSIRAVAVETGKIIASQSVTLSAVGELGELFTRGVTNTADDGSSPRVDSTPRTLRDRLRADSIKLTVQEVAIASRGADGFEPARISFGVENRSGIGLGLAIREWGYSAGACSAGEFASDTREGVRGINVISAQTISQLTQESDPAGKMRWFPPGAKVTGSIIIAKEKCNSSTLGNSKTVPVTVTFVLAAGKDVVLLPLSVENASVRLMAP
jgi:curli biogenesis system outer membrane secretion channel CsgG